MVDKMALFNYEQCKIIGLHDNNGVKTELSKVLPANVCNIVGEYKHILRGDTLGLPGFS